MPKQVQLRRGTTGQTAVFTGAQGEITVDTDKKTAVVHDGSTAGGFPLLREADGFKRTNNLSELSSRSAARDNLDVLWADDVRGMFSVRSSGGLAFDGAASFRISGNSPVNLGLNDFSISFVARLPDYTPATTHTIFATHNAGNNKVQIQILPDGRLSVQFHDSGGTITNYSIAPDVALIDGEVYQFVLTCDRDGLATLYVNGITDRSKDAAASTVSIAAAAAIDIGAGNSNAWAGCHATSGNIYALAVYNRILSSADVLALVKSGHVAAQDQWGLIGAFYTSDFSAGADSWAQPVEPANVSAGGNTDGVNGSNDWLAVTRLNSTGRMDVARTLYNATKRSRLRATIFNPPGSPITHFQINYAGVSTLVTPAAVSVPGGTEAQIEFEWFGTWPANELRVVPCNASGVSQNHPVGTVYYVKNIQLFPLGALLDLDLAGADPAKSLTIRDRSSNANDASAAAIGVSQVCAAPQMNASFLTVGGGGILNKLLTATAALNFGSIAAGASADLTITLNGAAVGDSVALGLPNPPTSGIVYQAFVSAANTVTVRATNITAGAIDPASMTFRVTVMQF
jgi:hypothetical protein